MYNQISRPFRKSAYCLTLLASAVAGSCASNPHHGEPRPDASPASPQIAPNQTPKVAPATQPASEPTGVTAEPASAPAPEPSTVPATEPTTAPATEPSTAPTTGTSTAPTTQPASHPTTEAKALFDGQDLDGWTVTDFAGHGEPKVENASIILPAGETLTGVNLKQETPHVNYDVDLDAQRVMGSDFFCGLTAPVNDTHISLIIGGWGGGVCGISSIDQNDAARNDTTSTHRFEKGKWYHIRLRVTATHLQAWIDDDQIVDTTTKGHQLSVRAEVEPSQPFGICSYQTTAAIRHIVVRPLSDKEIADAESDK